jgi:hypothetical protein
MSGVTWTDILWLFVAWAWVSGGITLVVGYWLDDHIEEE